MSPQKGSGCPLAMLAARAGRRRFTVGAEDPSEYDRVHHRPDGAYHGEGHRRSAPWLPHSDRQLTNSQFKIRTSHQFSVKEFRLSIRKPRFSIHHGRYIAAGNVDHGITAGRSGNPITGQDSSAGTEGHRRYIGGPGHLTGPRARSARLG